MNFYLKPRPSWLITPLIASGLLATGYTVSSFGHSNGALTPFDVKVINPQCFPIEQASWSGDIRKATVNYNLVISDEHRTPAKVFVMFRLRGNPEQLWILDQGIGQDSILKWTRYDGKKPIAYLTAGGVVQNISTDKAPADLSSLTDVGELLVGYGLSASFFDDPHIAYTEMWQSNRVRVIWDSVNYLRPHGTLCLQLNKEDHIERFEPYFFQFSL